MNDTTSPGPDQPAHETRPLGDRPGTQQTLDPEPPSTSQPPAAGPPETYGAPQGGYHPYPGYAPAAGYPGHPAAPRPRFRDQVLGMRAVVAVALVALVLGGLGGGLLGALTSNGDDGRFGGGPGFNPGQLPHQGQQPQQPFQQFQP